MIAGFEKPTEGDIYIYDKLANNIPPYKRKTNLIFQNLALFPNMNVYKNIAFGLEMRGFSSKDIERKVFKYLEIIDLCPIEIYAKKLINMLSGGEKQRVAIARSLVLEPAVLLLDEPLSNLDLKLREQMKIELKMIQHRVKTTFIYVTHDQTEASAMSNRIGVMNNGSLYQIGNPEELYDDPVNEFVAKFIGDSNKMSGIAINVKNNIVNYKSGNLKYFAISKDKIERGDAVNVYIKVENVSILDDNEVKKYKNFVEVKIKEIVFEGNSKRIICEFYNGQIFNTLIFGRKNLRKYKIGEKIKVGWNIEDAKAYRR